MPGRSHQPDVTPMPTDPAPEERAPGDDAMITLLRRLDLGRVAGLVFGGAGGLMILGGIAMVFDDPAGFALIAFGAVFAGAGYAAYRVMRTPKGRKTVAVSEHTSAIRAPLGVTGTRTRSVLIHVDEDATEEEITSARRQWRQDRWQRRPDWVTGRITTEETRTGGLLRGAAVAWQVFAWGFVAVSLLWLDLPWIILAGPVVVAQLLTVAAVRAALLRRKFGPSTLQLHHTPVFLGERLLGTVETGVQERHGPPDGFRVRVACEHRVEYEDRDDHTHIRSTVLWEHEHRVDGQSAPGLPRRLHVPLDLPLPDDQPSSTLDSDREGIFWELTVSAAVPGLDYRATFRLPAFLRADDPTRTSS